MPTALDAPEVLNREFLEVRARLLEIAAALDRLDRAQGSVGGDDRLKKIERAMAVLVDGKLARAERVQMIFSRAYSDNWRSELKLDRAK